MPHQIRIETGTKTTTMAMQEAIRKFGGIGEVIEMIQGYYVWPVFLMDSQGNGLYLGESLRKELVKTYS
jgi:hypothetical protein